VPSFAAIRNTVEVDGSGSAPSFIENVALPVPLSMTSASRQLEPSGETFTWKSSSPVRPVSARPEKPV
jgi:hypothetical protein